MEISLIGISHNTASIELRERLAFRVEQACEAADQLRARGILKEVVVLSTCNRTEVYGVAREHSSDNLPAMEMFIASYHRLAPADLSAVVYRHSDRSVVRHLYRVAAGLDSLLLGESEILGQVREAYRVAMDHGSTGRVLNRLFQSALEVGKRIRTETQIGTRPMSVAFAGVKQAESLLLGLTNQRVMIVGAGATSEQVVKHLCDRGVPQLRLLNRTQENAKALVARYGGEVLPWEQLPYALDWPDLIVTSVTTPEPILTREHLEAAMEVRKNRPLVIMDLGLPRNVDSRAKSIPQIHLSDIDSLTEIVEHNKKAREEEIPRAIALIDEQMEGFMRWQAGVAACSAFAELRAVPQHKREALVRKHLAALPHMTEPERLHFTGLLEKFLRDSGDHSFEYSRVDEQVHRNS
jgi:glutamyl-tRNA reductase